MQQDTLLQRGRNYILRQHFSAFLYQCFKTLNPGVEYLQNWHIDLIGEYLDACRTGQIQRLVINLPPRSLKSICVSVAWPAFLLGHTPSERIMAASYSSSLSIKHSLDCRHILQSAWYRALFPNVILSHDQNEKHKFTTTAFGHRIATSVGGSATGEGANFLIVDDLQNPAQAMSDATREFANRWFDQTFSTRLDDKQRGVIVVVMQRLHAEDLTGHVLEKGGWEHLCLPAIADMPTFYTFGRINHFRAEGEILHPAREDKALIERAKRELGSFAFAAQYQQTPLPEEGGMIKRSWFRRYHAILETFTRIVQSWDTAIKAKDHHDASVCITFGEHAEGIFVLDVAVLRLEYPELKRTVVRYADDWCTTLILMEDKASGQSLLQDLAREHHLALLAIQPHGDKVTRFAQGTALIEAGKLALPTHAAWLADFETELLAFPNSTHDDQVDALSQYLNWWQKAICLRPMLRRI